jgi:hypothetical protein
MRVAIRTPASVGESLNATFPITIEDLVAGLARNAEFPAEFRHRFAGEPQTAFFRPSPNTPSKTSLPPLGEEVSPMYPVRCVAYVSGRSLSIHVAASSTRRSLGAYRTRGRPAFSSHVVSYRKLEIRCHKPNRIEQAACVERFLEAKRACRKPVLWEVKRQSVI